MPTAYDQVPYPCNAYPQTHPGHLAAIARLQGMEPAPPAKCRYLEIGCGDGGNLLPLAYALPGSEFLGIDLAATSIEAANHHAREFDQKNVSFQALDLMQLDPAELGRWDYIVAHGVFSWVPEPVRLRLLALCRELLAPQGVAFISYNAYPGCHLRHMAREMMLYHTENAPDPESKIKQARALMSFLAESHGTDDEYGTLLRVEAGRVLKYAPNHFYHDDLAALNQPFYLHEFADLAAAHGLQYLGDADYSSMHATRYPAQVRDVLAGLGDDAVRREQYLDFIKCRRFRQTLLCQQEAPLTRAASNAVLHSLWYSSSARPVTAAARLEDDSPVEFSGEHGLQLSTSHPAAKIVLARLGAAWPDRLSFAELADSSPAPESSTEDAPTPGSLEHILAEFLQMGTAEAHAQPAPFTTQPGERPQASAWALYQQRLGGGITTLRHHTVHIQDPFGLWLLGQLDGSKTLEEIAHALASTVKPDADGKLDFEKELGEARALVSDGCQKIIALGLTAHPQQAPKQTTLLPENRPAI